MSPSSPVLRAAGLSALVAVLLATSGCSWFRKDHALYAESPENRPLEVPPDLDRPGTTGAMALPGPTASATRSDLEVAAAGPALPAAGGVGFAVAAERDQAYERVGQVLAATPGLSVASSAQLLGTYDVAYEGASFMVRVARAEGGSYVSAVDPRGQPAQGAAAQKLIAALREQMGR